MTRPAPQWTLALLLLGSLVATAAAAQSDATRAERELAEREARQVIFERAERRAREAVMATERGRAHVAECLRTRGPARGEDVFYHCRMDRWQPFRGAYERLYRAFWKEEAARYARER